MATVWPWSEPIQKQTQCFGHGQMMPAKTEQAATNKIYPSSSGY
jgi:hypothetical protein